MSETKRKIFVVVVLGLVLLFGIGQFFAFSNFSGGSSDQSQAGQNPPTQVIAYTPVIPASSTPVSGSCFAGSIAAPYRPDAWRCMVGNAISDPCFALPGSGNVLCGVNPASLQVSAAGFVLKPTKPLPQPEMASSTPGNQAWLLELADGTLCSPFTGTRPFSSGGDVATYSCNGSSTGETMVFGNLQDTSGTWFAELGLLSNDTSTYPPALVASTTIPVAIVWQ